MKLTKDYFIEGQVIPKGTEIEILNESNGSIKEKRIQESAFVVGSKTLSDVTDLIYRYMDKGPVMKLGLKKIFGSQSQEIARKLYNFNVEAVRNRYGGEGDAGYQTPYRGSSADYPQQFLSLQAYIYQVEDSGDQTIVKVLREFKQKVASLILEDMSEGGYWGD